MQTQNPLPGIEGYSLPSIDNALSRIAVLEVLLRALREETARHFETNEKATERGLDAGQKTAALAQYTADKAVSKIEGAANKEHLETQIVALRETLSQQIESYKNALDAALVSARNLLAAAQMSSEKAVEKAEAATEKRFESVYEFRDQITHQTRTLATKEEVDYRFSALDKKSDTNDEWHRRIELKFGEYIPQILLQRREEEWAEWRRKVDSALTAAASRSGMMYAIIAMAIAVGGLLVGVFNAFSKVSTLAP